MSGFAVACTFESPSSWDKRIKYEADGAFDNQDIKYHTHGTAPVKIGEFRIAQRVLEGGGCEFIESVIIADCKSKRSIKIYGSGLRSVVLEDGTKGAVFIEGAIEHRLDHHLAPEGPVRLNDPSNTLEDALEQAKQRELKTVPDFVKSQFTLKRKNRIDPFRSCERFFPNLTKAG